jgi:hypothetical protein
MGRSLVPEEYWEMVPKWRNFTENLATVQFNHRVLVRVDSGRISLVVLT